MPAGGEHVVLGSQRVRGPKGAREECEVYSKTGTKKRAKM